MKSNGLITIIKVLVLTILTFGLYGAYWIMSNLFKEPDINDDEIDKKADYVRRAAGSAMLTLPRR